MAALRDVMVYLCRHFPHKNELSKARVAKMAYLADWRSAIDFGRQMTDTIWVLEKCGPFSEEVFHVAASDPDLYIEHVYMLGSDREVVRVKCDAKCGSLTDADEHILDIVIKSSASRDWSEFIRFVASTYPIMTQPRMASLDLVALAEGYAEAKKAFEQSA